MTTYRKSPPIEQDDDDPFMQGSSPKARFEYDEDDPFNAPEQVTFLPHACLTLALSFCEPPAILAATSVSRGFSKAAAENDAWRPSCEAKFGEGVLEDHEGLVVSMGMKAVCLGGLCRSVMVTTPEYFVITLRCYPGLTIRDLLHSLGIENRKRFGLESEDFTEEVDDALEDTSEGIPKDVYKTALSDILIEPMSRLRIIQLQGGAPPPDEDDEAESGRRVALAKQVQEHAVDEWKTRGRKKLGKLIPYVVSKVVKNQFPELVQRVPSASASRAAPPRPAGGVGVGAGVGGGPVKTRADHHAALQCPPPRSVPGARR